MTDPRSKGEPEPRSEWDARRVSFGSQADTYAHGRPDYPADVVRWCLPRDVEPGAAHVLDLGAGTGKLTRVALDLGCQVTAVEPLPEMRGLIDARATVLDGTAEAIPVEDGTIDLVLAGQAWHWFDAERTLPEVARVLAPHGTLGLLWNLFDDSVDWVRAFVEVTGEEARASSMVSDGAPVLPSPYSSDLLEEPAHRVFTHTPSYDADRLVAYVASISRFILMPAAERDAVLAEVRRVAPAGEFALPLVTHCWRGERS